MLRLCSFLCSLLLGDPLLASPHSCTFLFRASRDGDTRRQTDGGVRLPDQAHAYRRQWCREEFAPPPLFRRFLRHELHADDRNRLQAAHDRAGWKEDQAAAPRYRRAGEVQDHHDGALSQRDGNPACVRHHQRAKLPQHRGVAQEHREAHFAACEQDPHRQQGRSPGLTHALPPLQHASSVALGLKQGPTGSRISLCLAQSAHLHNHRTPVSSPRSVSLAFPLCLHTRIPPLGSALHVHAILASIFG